MRTTLSLAVLALASIGGASAAHARQVRYVGAHPVGHGHAGVLCHIEAPHVHAYAPERADVLYRVHDGAYFFVGDPVAFAADYDGPRVTYYGHHPVHVDVLVDGAAAPAHDPEYCYLDGPHYHGWAPGADARFTMHGGAYWYVGPYGASYKRDRRRYVAINAVYRPIVYARPVVEVDPPVGWVGARVDVHGPAVAVAAPVVDVHGPEVHAGIAVEVPMPTLEIGFGAGVLVDGHTHVHDVHCHHGRAHGHHHHKGKKARYKRWNGRRFRDRW